MQALIEMGIIAKPIILFVMTVGSVIAIPIIFRL